MKSELDRYVKACVEDYLKFIGESEFPEFEIITKRITLDTWKKQGYDCWAATLYNAAADKHILKVWEDVYLPQSKAEHVMFHELTHILDAERYAKGNKTKYMINEGFTEYHASQIEFMKLLGVSNIKDVVSFSMSQTFETIEGEKTALQLLRGIHETVVYSIEQADFPANFKIMTATLAGIFNYYGFRSICKMYAKDFKDEIDNSAIEKFIGKKTVKALDVFMLGWLEPERVAKVDTLFGNLVIYLVQKYGL